jgi:WD40 repeat protein
MKSNSKNLEIREFLNDGDKEDIHLVDFSKNKINSNFLLLLIFQKNTGAINMSSIVLDDGLDISRRFYDEFLSYIDYILPLKYQYNPIVNSYVLRVLFTGNKNFIYDIDFSNDLKDIFIDMVNACNKLGFVLNDENVNLFDEKYKNIYKLYNDIKKDNFFK